MKKSTLLVLIVFLIGTVSPSPVVSDTTPPGPVPTQEPNLTTVKVSKTKTCGVNGAAKKGTEKAKLNQLKNRFKLPSGDFKTITFDDILALNQGPATGPGKKAKVVDFPDSGDPNNQGAVTLEGFV